MQKIKLGDVLDVKRGASLPGKYYSSSGEKIRLTLGNFNYPNRGFKKNTSKNDLFFNGPIKDEFILKKGDIITPLTEQVKGLLGETALIPEDDKYIQSGDIGLIIPDEEKLDKNFAYYLVSSSVVRKQLAAGSQKTKIRHTSPDAIKDCVAWIPEKKEQIKIAKFLDSLNSRIATDDQLIENMETVVSLYYEHWFLQFDFPNKDGKPYRKNGGNFVWSDELKKKIPEGWKCVSLSDFSSINNTSVNPEKSTVYQHFSIPAYDSDKTPAIEYGSCIESNKYKVENNSILVSKLNPKFKRVWFVGEVGSNAICSTEFMPFTTDDKLVGYLYGVLNSKHFNVFMVQGASSSTGSRKRMDPDLCKSYMTVYPDESTISEFNKKVFPLLKEISLLRMDIHRMVQLRDYITPLLLNGQATLSE